MLTVATFAALSAATTSLSRGFVSACCLSVSSLPWNCMKERKEHPSVEQSAAVRGTMLTHTCVQCSGCRGHKTYLTTCYMKHWTQVVKEG